MPLLHAVSHTSSHKCESNQLKRAWRSFPNKTYTEVESGKCNAVFRAGIPIHRLYMRRKKILTCAESLLPREGARVMQQRFIYLFIYFYNRETISCTLHPFLSKRGEKINTTKQSLQRKRGETIRL